MNKRHFFILTAIVILFSIAGYITLKKDIRPYLSVSSLPLDYTISMYQSVLDKDINGILGNGYEPFNNIFAAFLAILFNRNFLLIVLTQNTLYYLFIVFFLYLIVKETDEEKSALFSVFVLSSYPLFYGLMPILNMDMGVTAAACVSVYSLIKSRHFTIRKWSVLLGVSIGIGMLNKYTFFIFLAGPVFISMIYALKERKTTYMNIVMAALTFMIIISPRYFRLDVIDKILTVSFHEIKGHWYNWEYLEEMPIGLIHRQLSPPFFCFFIVAAVFFIKRYQKKEHLLILFTWFLLPLIYAVSLSRTIYLGFYAPYLPAFAAITSIGFYRMRLKFFFSIRNIFIVIGSINFLEYFCGLPIGLKKIQFNISGKIFPYYKPEISQHINMDDIDSTLVEYEIMEHILESGVKNILSVGFHGSYLHTLGWVNNLQLKVDWMNPTSFVPYIINDSSENIYDVFILPELYVFDTDSAIKHMRLVSINETKAYPHIQDGFNLTDFLGIIDSEEFRHRYVHFIDSLKNYEIKMRICSDNLIYPFNTGEFENENVFLVYIKK